MYRRKSFWIYIYTQECVKNCPIKDLKHNICIQNFKNDKKDEELGSDIENNEDNDKEDTKAQDIMLQILKKDLLLKIMIHQI